MGIDTVSMLAPDQVRAEAFYQNLLAAAFDALTGNFAFFDNAGAQGGSRAISSPTPRSPARRPGR